MLNIQKNIINTKSKNKIKEIDKIRVEHINYLKSSLGDIILLAQDNILTGCHFETSKHLPLLDKYIKNSNIEIFTIISEYIKEYSQGKNPSCKIEYHLTGTDFQLSVWDRVKKIPYGKTISYKQIAHDIGRPKSVRAVANAIGKNPISIFIPCHRVIGSDGSITGYAGGIEVKQRLLDIETNKIKCI